MSIGTIIHPTSARIWNFVGVLQFGSLCVLLNSLLKPKNKGNCLYKIGFENLIFHCIAVSLCDCKDYSPFFIQKTWLDKKYRSPSL